MNLLRKSIIWSSGSPMHNSYVHSCPGYVKLYNVMLMHVQLCMIMYSLCIVYVYLCIVYVYLCIVMYSYVYLCILMYTFACCLPACLAGWLEFWHLEVPGSDWSSSLMILLRKSIIWSSGGPRLRLVKFLYESIKKINHLELWKSHAQFLCTLMPWVCKIIQCYAYACAIMYDYV